MKTLTLNKKTTVASFNSARELLEDIQRPPIIEQGKLDSEIIGKPDFYGTNSLDEAINEAQKGNRVLSEMADKFRNNFSDIGAELMNVKDNFAVEYAPAGHAPNVGRYLQGRPDCMYRPKIRESAGKRLTIVVDRGAASDISNEQITRRGSTICALISELERHGYSTALFVSTYTVNSSSALHIITPIKRPGDYFTVDNLAFWTSSPAVIRRLYFAVKERLPTQTLTDTFSVKAFYGTSSIKISADDLYPAISAATSGQVRREELIYIPNAEHYSSFFFEEDAINWLKAVIENNPILKKGN